jgi:hypothetical protein
LTYAGEGADEPGQQSNIRRQRHLGVTRKAGVATANARLLAAATTLHPLRIEQPTIVLD